MQSFREIGKKYGATKFQGDLHPGQTFEQIYDDIFAPFRQHNPLKILEIGIQEGGSLRVWKEYFPHAQIVGIDIDPSSLYEEERIATYLIDQSDEKALGELLKVYGYFDIVIDDGSHLSTHQIISLKVLLPKTKYIYCIEDLDTSYPEIFPNHSEKGKDSIIMVLKNIVDQAVLERNEIERIDFRKRFCAIYKKKEMEFYPKVSIIMLSHNRPQYLEKAIESVINQTITDWELIIIDDFSTDLGVLGILKQAKKDPRVRVFRTNYDVGNIAVLWNMALDRAKGRYISFLDDDNLKRPSFCEELSKYLDEHLEFEAVACFNEYMEGDRLTGDIFDKPKYANKYNILKNNQIDSGCMMIRRTVVDRIGWFDERLKTVEDWDYVKRIMLQTAGFGIIEQPLAIYRWHKENRMHRSEDLGFQKHQKFIQSGKNYSDKLKLLLFHPDEDKITLSQNNVLRGIRDALKIISWLKFKSISVSNFKKINSKYDIVFCFSPFLIDLEYIKALKKFSEEIINFHIEDPQALWANLERAKYATHIFTNDISVQSEYEKVVGKGNVGYCPSISLNDISLKFRDNVKKKYDIIFVGYPYDSRVKFIRELLPEIKKKDYGFTLVGGDWSKRGIDLPCIDEVNEQDLLKIMEESKITVLYNRRNTDLGIDPKIIKPVSVVRGYLECGSDSLVMLDNERPHHSFNGEVVFYNGIDDLVEQVDYYIRNEQGRENISSKAKQRALRDFTYRARITKLLNAVKSRRFYYEVM